MIENPKSTKKTEASCLAQPMLKMDLNYNLKDDFEKKYVLKELKIKKIPTIKKGIFQDHQGNFF